MAWGAIVASDERKTFDDDDRGPVTTDGAGSGEGVAVVGVRGAGGGVGPDRGTGGPSGWGLTDENEAMYGVLKLYAAEPNGERAQALIDR